MADFKANIKHDVMELGNEKGCTFRAFIIVVLKSWSLDQSITWELTGKKKNWGGIAEM